MSQNAPPAPVGSATMQDVAAAAGLSRATVSKYFNGSDSLKPETRERIERACRELNYVPDMHAVSLVKGRSNLIGVVLPFISEPFFGKVLQVIERRAAQYGQQVVIQASNNDPQREAAALLTLRAMKVHGIVFTPIASRDNLPLIEQLQQELRIVFLDSYFNEDCHFVMNDNRQSIALAVNYLLSRSAIPAYLAAPNVAIPSRPERLAGYEAAMRAAGHAPIVIPDNPASTTWQFEAYAYEQVLAWCANGGLAASGASALVCATDRLAIGAAKALRRFGRRPGHDILLAGHDNIDICDYLDPMLTTVHQDIDRIGQAAVDCLQTGADGQQQDGFFQRRFPGRLVIRESA
ncbi:LacI family DNA-binding transcriptional regulator [Chitinilyticum litopenaei]|uniref:LacI family DNA-binding transcriptional regulator n=1 Tax=Chitinilyticum litopenaei TaxID=1121276 RepID=UPI000404EB2F|nr:LacI family DNA-binding transcriptional regulator [Chitinilyticum litopenaei]